MGKSNNSILRSLLIAVMVSALILLDFGISRYAGLKSAERYMKAHPTYTISSAKISDNGELLITVSNGYSDFTLNAGSVWQDGEKKIESMSINNYDEIALLYSDGSTCSSNMFSYLGTEHVEHASIDDSGRLTVAYMNGQKASLGLDLENASDEVYIENLTRAESLLSNNGITMFDNIVVASGGAFPDALSGGYLCTVKRAPIILIRNSKKVRNSVQQFIKEHLNPDGTIYILGGEVAVATEWLGDLLEQFNYKRLGGETRYETNLAILEEIGNSYNNINDPTGIDNIEIREGNLYIILGNGQMINAGSVVGPKGENGRDGHDGKDGVGIASINIDDEGNLVINLTDGTSTNLGTIVGKNGKDGKDGEDGKDGADGVGITDIQIDQTTGNMTITLSNGTTLNLGNVKGAKGDKGDKGDAGEDGNGIASATINDSGELVVTYTDGTSTNLGTIKGTNGTNGVDGEDGVSVANVVVNEDGNLIITLSDGTEIAAGVVKGDKGDKGETGIGIDGATINENGELVLVYSDGTTTTLGTVTGAVGANGKDGVGVSNVELTSEGKLVITLTDGTIKNLGNVKGEKGDKGDPGQNGADGKDGKGISSVTINSGGYLIITYTDGTTQNAGKVTGSGSTNDYSVGSIITMGKYEQDNNTANGAEPIEWIVVANNGKEALLLSKDVLEVMQFGNGGNGGYMNTSLRNWLIGDFYETAFASNEKERIVEPHIYEDSVSTTDPLGDTNKVFLLTLDQMRQLQIMNLDLVPEMNDYVRSKVSSNVVLFIWTRSGGATRQCYYWYFNVDNDSYHTVPYIRLVSTASSYPAGVRPAIWVKIGE